MTPNKNSESDQKALDQLFHLTSTYRNQTAFNELINFISIFRAYSPYNAMLIHVQKPGAVFVAPADRWRREYGRTIKVGARPLVILQPMGPVMFVFDAADTEGKPLPDDVIKPFSVGGEKIGNKFAKTLENAMRDGIETHFASMGSQRAGSICIHSPHKNQFFRDELVPVRYSLELKQEASKEENYATLAHELGHLYCGHLGTPYSKWWPSRKNTTLQIREIEAESVAHLVCSRFGLKNASEKYLSGYVDPEVEMPPISLESILKAAGMIERMAKTLMPLRKQPPPKKEAPQDLPLFG